MTRADSAVSVSCPISSAYTALVEKVTLSTSKYPILSYCDLSSDDNSEVFLAKIHAPISFILGSLVVFRFFPTMRVAMLSIAVFLFSLE